jgi:hypothetical protein
VIRTTASAALLLAGLTLTAAPSDGQTRVDRQASCVAWNGHFTTYDGYRYNDYTPDIVWLMTDDRNADHPFRVEVETAPYGPMAVFRRAAVRCGENILVADAGTDRNVFLLDGQELAPGETPFGVQGDRANLTGNDPQAQLHVICGERSVSIKTGGRILTGVNPRLTHYL